MSDDAEVHLSIAFNECMLSIKSVPDTRKRNQLIKYGQLGDFCLIGREMKSITM